jgi:hypothetical protein
MTLYRVTNTSYPVKGLADTRQSPVRCGDIVQVKHTMLDGPPKGLLVEGVFTAHNWQHCLVWADQLEEITGDAIQSSN